MPNKMTASQAVFGVFAFFRYLAIGGLFNINLEVTKRCNARCSFCNYWKENPPDELKTYGHIVRKLKPLSVSLTGGEPLLRKDLPGIIRDLRENSRFLYISLVTNGALLTYRRGIELWEAGLDELSISLDYLDERHDRARGIAGLAAHILSVAPALKRAGIHICYNVIVKKENHREIPDLIRHAGREGIRISFSAFNPRRTGNGQYETGNGEVEALRKTIGEILLMRKRCRTITSSTFYLERIPEFLANGGIPGCTAGLNWIQVAPDGSIKRCPDRTRTVPYLDWKRGFFNPSRCTSCWYSCRGAAQEPMTVRRFLEMAKEALFD